MPAPEEAAVFAARGWLSVQPESFRDAVLSSALRRDVQLGEGLLQAGDPPGGVFGVISGGVAVYAQVGNLLPRMGTIIRAGGWFGTASMATGLPRYISARVQEPSQLVYFPLSRVEAMIKADPLAARMFAGLAEFNAWLSVALACELAISSAPRRVAAVLMRATGAHFGLVPSHPDGFPLTQSEIGEMANVSRLHTNRVLGTFCKQGWISMRYGRVRVCDPGALSAYAWNEE
jgi:CRP/FNR family cyclic AMP-dependent transcriptional regulator